MSEQINSLRNIEKDMAEVLLRTKSLERKQRVSAKLHLANALIAGVTVAIIMALAGVEPDRLVAGGFVAFTAYLFTIVVRVRLGR